MHPLPPFPRNSGHGSTLASLAPRPPRRGQPPAEGPWPFRSIKATSYRKGVLFTLIGLLLSGLFILLFSTQVRTPRDAQTVLIQHEADQMFTYSQDLAAYTKDALELSTKKALIGMVDFFANVTPPWAPPTTEQEVRCAFSQMVENGTAFRPRLQNFKSDLIFYLVINGQSRSPSTGGGGPGSGEVPFGGHDPASPDAESVLLLQAFRQDAAVADSGFVEYFEIQARTAAAPAARTLRLQLYEFPSDGCLQRLGKPLLTHEQQVATGPVFTQVVLTNPPGLRMDAETVYLLVLSCPDCGLGEILAVLSTDHPAEDDEGDIDPLDLPHLLLYSNATHWAGNWTTRSTGQGEVSDRRGQPKGQGNDTLVYYLDRMNAFSQAALGITTAYQIHNISIEQTLPFEIEATASITTRLFNPHLSYDLDASTTAVVALDGIPDPLFTYNHFYNKTINQTAFDNDQNLDILEFTQFHEKGWYRYQRDAPGFMQRLLNSTEASECCGIESTVDPLRFPTLDGPPPGPAGSGVYQGYARLSFATDINAGKAINASYFDYLFFETDDLGVHRDFGCNASFTLNFTALPTINDLRNYDLNDPDHSLEDNWTVETHPLDPGIWRNLASWDIGHLAAMDIPLYYWLSVCTCNDPLDPAKNANCPTGTHQP